LVDETATATEGWDAEPACVEISESILKSKLLSKIVFQGSDAFVFLLLGIAEVFAQYLTYRSVRNLLQRITGRIHIMNLKVLDNNHFSTQIVKRYTFHYAQHINIIDVFRSKRLKSAFPFVSVTYL
jgi:hypothetical protein